MTDLLLDLEIHSGDKRMTDLGNAVSDAIYEAVAHGLPLDFACSVVTGVAADYWMDTYQKPCAALADILMAKEAKRAEGKEK